MYIFSSPYFFIITSQIRIGYTSSKQIRAIEKSIRTEIRKESSITLFFDAPKKTRVHKKTHTILENLP